MNKSMNFLEFSENEYSFMDSENYENIKYSQNNLGNQPERDFLRILFYNQ